MPKRRKPEKIEVGRQYRLQWMGVPCEKVIHVLRIESLENCRHVYVELIAPHGQKLPHQFYSYTEIYRRIWAEEARVMQ